MTPNIWYILSDDEIWFFVAGRWRNFKEVKKVLDTVRASGETAYCFIENLYEGQKVEFKQDDKIESIMQKLEALAHDDVFIRQVFDNDIPAEKKSKYFLLVLPAGISCHIEAGAAYGMGKKCFAAGVPDKTETLYQIFDNIFPDLKSLDSWLKSN